VNRGDPKATARAMASKALAHLAAQLEDLGVHNLTGVHGPAPEVIEDQVQTRLFLNNVSSELRAIAGEMSRAATIERIKRRHRGPVARASGMSDGGMSVAPGYISPSSVLALPDDDPLVLNECSYCHRPLETGEDPSETRHASWCEA
jgi:hypothetical protein